MPPRGIRIRGAMPRKEDVAMSVAVMMNQMFRVGVGFAAWCALRQILMVRLTYV